MIGKMAEHTTDSRSAWNGPNIGHIFLRAEHFSYSLQFHRQKIGVERRSYLFLNASYMALHATSRPSAPNAAFITLLAFGILPRSIVFSSMSFLKKRMVLHISYRWMYAQGCVLSADFVDVCPGSSPGPRSSSLS